MAELVLDLTRGPGAGWVYVWYSLALALLVTVFSARSLKGRLGEYRGTLVYFLLFFLLLAGLPAAAVGLAYADGLSRLVGLGVKVGRLGLGSALCVAFVPFGSLILLGSARNPAVAAKYPLARSGLGGPGQFLLYETAYLLFYYTAWEFCFRGVFLLGIVPLVGLVPALGIQTALSMLYHIGHPRSEILLSVLGGLFLGIVAHVTGSLLYPILIHAAVGVGVDCVMHWSACKAG